MLYGILLFYGGFRVYHRDMQCYACEPTGKVKDLTTGKDVRCTSCARVPKMTPRSSETNAKSRKVSTPAKKKNMR